MGKMFEVRANEWDELFKVKAMVPLHKKRGRDQVNNFQGVCLLSMCSRVLGRVIAKRVERWVEHQKLLDENQPVFREGRSTADVVQVMTRIQVDVVGCKCRVNEDANVMNKDEWPCAKLLDLKKAYPIVSKSAFWSLLERYGMKGQCLEMLVDLHDTTEYRVKCREGMSEGWMPARVHHVSNPVQHLPSRSDEEGIGGAGCRGEREECRMADGNASAFHRTERWYFCLRKDSPFSLFLQISEKKLTIIMTDVHLFIYLYVALCQWYLWVN